MSRNELLQRDVKSAKRVVDILEFLSHHSRGATLLEIGQALHIPQSSCHGLMETLRHSGYVVRDDITLSYCLSSKLLGLGTRHNESLDIVQAADPVMERMKTLCGESISLAVLQKTDVVFIYKKTQDSVIRIVNPIGTRLPAHATALGKVILAELSDETLDMMYRREKLSALTPHTITHLGALKKCLTEVRRTGIGHDTEESSIGLHAVGAVIKNFEDLPVAALSIATLRIQQNSPPHQRCLEQLVKVGAAIISVRMGCSTLEDPGDLSSLGQILQGTGGSRSANQATGD